MDAIQIADDYEIYDDKKTPPTYSAFRKEREKSETSRDRNGRAEKIAILDQA